MQIAVVGTGYVGLVTGVCLSDIGHHVICVDIDEQKVERMRKGISPIYEPGLEELMVKNYEAGRLNFTTEHNKAFKDADVIYIAVGTPQQEDGTADLRFVEQVAIDIAENLQKDAIVITKSTVPVGTNEKVKRIILEHIKADVKVEVASNPEFLREGSAVSDTFNGDRIVIGTESEEAANTLEELYKPFGIPVFKTDIRSAEMIKYASNAFLATKISFINEISNLCEKLGANVGDVAQGMGMDDRIGNKFLQAGIGYGGSCFPKDTNALVQIASFVEHEFNLLKSVIQVNNEQQRLLMKKAKERFGSLKGMKIALLGLAFKPNTDDMREAASIILSEELVREGAEVIAYDPIAMDNAKKLLPEQVQYAGSAEEAVKRADAVFIVTEWNEVKEITFHDYENWLETPVVFDGRNCYSLEEAGKHQVEYHSIGRRSIYPV
ncbi:UDP-glucose dehydrogenase family protein [Metabacillus fastidiosus]|uniref:UDP-glucose dehydrogenase family protein n=1 Tax=Metabacillus fastidiosus TaxID=1458 RepID=UPI000826D29E|nr:UDP-glucose/GDP-mannose dehydrogenase family protein [Metabacillus fastidiosus]MED4464477.1 UDP-glucose/GDP-mannose dehydrogenase family protein [Metabacillus fastidiosus]